MLSVFMLQISCETAAKLGVKGSEYYLSPFVWLLLLIVPIIGWTLLTVMIIYIYVWTLVALYNGNGEKFID